MKITHLNAMETGQALGRLMRNYDEFHWAVAWATDTRWAEALAKHHAHKMVRVVIGTDFNHTSPALLRTLQGSSSVKAAASQPGCTFHPKVFVFTAGDRAAAVVGSSNFTRGGLERNQEASLFLEGSRADPVLNGLIGDVAQWWKQGQKLTPEFLDGYELQFKLTKKHREALADSKVAPRCKARPGAKFADILDWNWADYESNVLGRKKADERLRVLVAAGNIFAQCGSLDRMTTPQLRALCGVASEQEIGAMPQGEQAHWAWFGDMNRPGI